MDGISRPAALVLAVTFVMFAIGGMGGGDAKLMAATALWMGFNLNLLGYLVTSAFIGGLLTLAILSYRKSPLADMTGQNMFLRHFADRQGRRPLRRSRSGSAACSPIPDSPLVLWAIERLSAH